MNRTIYTGIAGPKGPIGPLGPTGVKGVYDERFEELYHIFLNEQQAYQESKEDFIRVSYQLILTLFILMVLINMLKHLIK